jgi:hypothetical protein
MLNNSFTIDVDDIIYGELIKHILLGYVGMVLALFGIVGNIITILVLISPSMRTASTNIYLIALSSSNILFLLMVIVFVSASRISEYRSFMKSQVQSTFIDFVNRVPHTPIIHALLVSIIYLTIAVAVDRLITIKHSFKAKQIITQRSTLIVILLIYIFSIIYSIPFWLERQYNPVLKIRVYTDIGWKMYKYIGRYIHFPVTHLIPIIILTCIHITIIKNLIAKKRRKRSLGIKTNITKQTDDYIILILVTVIIAFILCKLPLSILVVWYAIYPDDPKNKLISDLLIIISEFLFILNASTNFLIHCFFGEKFRQILMEFILRVMPNHDGQRNLPRQSLENQNLQAPEPKQIILARNSSTANDMKKSIDVNDSSNQSFIQNSSINHQEISPLIMTDLDEITVIHEDVRSKSDKNLN